MATVTRETLRQKLSNLLGDYRVITATSGSTTTIATTQFDELTQVNDGTKDLWVISTSSPNDGVIRRILSSLLAGSVATVSRAFGSAVASTHTFELHKYDPVDLHEALNRAIQLAEPSLYLPIRHENLVVDNLLLNPCFEDWTNSTTVAEWTAAGSVTPSLVQQTAFALQGLYSLRQSQGSLTGWVSQDVFTGQRAVELAGKSIKLVVWRLPTTGTFAAGNHISIDFGTTEVDSSDLVDEQEWQKLEVNTTVPANVSEITVKLHSSGTGQNIFSDVATLTIQDVYRYTLPTTLKSVLGVSYNLREKEVDGLYEPVMGKPPRGRILRIEGTGRLSTLTADTSTVEIDDSQAELVAALAARIFAQMMFARTRDVAWDGMAQRFQGDYAERATKGTLRQRKPIAQRRLGWHTEEDASGFYLVFDH